MCVCDVPEPEDRFNMDEYSELLIVNKPVVYISVSELLNTHKVCTESQDQDQHLDQVLDKKDTSCLQLHSHCVCVCV